MNGGVRARIEIESLADCPVAAAAADAGTRIDRIDRASGGRDGVVTEEFAIDADAVIVDRSALTERQRRVLGRAHELDYFEYPKGANAGEVAEDLGIARSTFTEHLAAAQSKLYDAILDGGVQR